MFKHCPLVKKVNKQDESFSLFYIRDIILSCSFIILALQWKQQNWCYFAFTSYICRPLLFWCLLKGSNFGTLPVCSLSMKFVILQSFFIPTKKITKWKGIFHISTKNCQKFLICAGFITFIFGKNFCFDQRGGKIISLNQKSLTKQGGHVNFSISFWACWCYPTFQKFQVVLTL